MTEKPISPNIPAENLHEPKQNCFYFIISSLNIFGLGCKCKQNRINIDTWG